MTYRYKPPAPTRADQTRRDIVAEFDRWNTQAGEIVVSDYDLPLAKPGELAAAVRFLLRGREVVMRIDAWDDFGTNLRCAYLNIRDMRLGEARGSLDGMREALLGLPAPTRERDPYEVIGVRPDADREDIEAMYRAKAKRLHPDAGGSPEAFKALQAAYEKVKR